MALNPVFQLFNSPLVNIIYFSTFFSMETRDRNLTQVEFKKLDSFVFLIINLKLLASYQQIIYDSLKKRLTDFIRLYPQISNLLVNGV